MKIGNVRLLELYPEAFLFIQASGYVLSVTPLCHFKALTDHENGLFSE